ncbi:MAG: UbiA family prenyltransferase [Xenococcaceae cyanobacterium]
MKHEEVVSITTLLWIAMIWGLHLYPLSWAKRFGKNAFWDYIRLLKPLYHANFLFVILGIIYLEKPLERSMIFDVGLFYISFNIFLYGGIYTFNAWKDKEQDAAHPRKRERPVASGRISSTQAIITSILGFCLAFTTAFLWFCPNILKGFFAIILVNLFYTLYARSLPYLDVAISGLTYPLRTWLGSQLVGINLPLFTLLAVYCLAIVMISGRRLLERRLLKWDNHKGYPQKTLEYIHICGLLGVLLSGLLALPHEPYIYARVVIYAAFFAYASNQSTGWKSLLLVFVVFGVTAFTLPFAQAQGRNFFVGDSLGICLITLLIVSFGRNALDRVFQLTFTT